MATMPLSFDSLGVDCKPSIGILCLHFLQKNFYQFLFSCSLLFFLGQPVDGKCQAELFDVRQQLMEDFSINPEVVRDCEKEIDEHCQKGTEREGKTIDCLMKLGEENKLGTKCYKAVSPGEEVPKQCTEMVASQYLYNI